MARRKSNRCDNERRGIAQEAARIMREEGVRDHLLAKRKAAQRLNIADRQALPANDESEQALREQQRLFGGDAYASRLRELRQVACGAMRMLEDFSPRLVGSVLSGAVTDQTPVRLHVFSDAPEGIALHLLERNIPYDFEEYRVRYKHDRHELRPVYAFNKDSIAIEAIVFSLTELRQPPTCPVDGRPMRRLRLPEVEALVDGGSETGDTVQRFEIST